MKKFILNAILLLPVIIANAQSDSIQPAYLRFPEIPPFELLQLDSNSIFRKNDLKKHQPVLLMFFSPDCDHCQHQIKDLLKDMKSFKKTEIILASYQPLEMIREFYNKYHLASYSNIHVGRDMKYFLPPFFRMYNLPFLALYDKRGTLITTFQGTTAVKKIAAKFD